MDTPEGLSTNTNIVIKIVIKIRLTNEPRYKKEHVETSKSELCIIWLNSDKSECSKTVEKEKKAS